MTIKVGVVVPVISEFVLAIQALESIRTKYSWQPYIIDNWRENKGVTRAWNLGAKAAFAQGCSHALIINDDVIIAPNAIDELVENWPKEYLLLGLTHHNDISNQPEDKTYDESPDFGGFMVKPETLVRMGEFDEEFFAWFSDNDTHHRINKLGFKAGRYHNAMYHHFHSVSTGAMDEAERAKWFNHDHDHYLQKWGGEPGHEQK